MPPSIGCLTNLEESSYVHVPVAAAMAAADVLRDANSAGSLYVIEVKYSV